MEFIGITLSKYSPSCNSFIKIFIFFSPYSNIPAKVWNKAKKSADDLGKKLTPFDIEYINIWTKKYKDLDKAIARWRVFRQSDSYKFHTPDGLSEMDRLLKPVDNMSIAELTQFQKELIDDIDIPMTEDMILMEEVIELLTPRELIELQKKKDWNSLLNLRKILKDKKAAMKEVKSDEAIRQGKPLSNPNEAPPNLEDMYSKGLEQP
jgi:hypothetical protein